MSFLFVFETLAIPSGDEKKEASSGLNYNIHYGSFAQLSSEEKDEANLVNIYARAKGDYTILPRRLKLVGDFKVQFRNGQVQQRYHEYDTKNYLHVYDFGLIYSPVSFADISIGSVGQKFLRSDLLVDDSWSFFGLKQKFRLTEKKNFQSAVILQQSLPSYNLENIHRAKREESALFFTGTLESSFQSESLDLVGFLTYYSFKNLPSHIAYSGGIMGNSYVNESLDLNVEFLYPFEGYVLGGEGVIFPSNKISFPFKAYYVKNYKASDKSADAQSLKGGMKYRFNEDFSISGDCTYFFNESDVSPAYYNSALHGNSNREGSIFEIDLFINKYKTKLSFAYITSEALRKNYYQHDLTTFIFEVDVFDVQF